MNEHDTKIWNAAIDAVLKAYLGGIPAILDLKKNHFVKVDHIGRSTKQEVVKIEE